MERSPYALLALAALGVLIALGVAAVWLPSGPRTTTPTDGPLLAIQLDGPPGSQHTWEATHTLRGRIEGPAGVAAELRVEGQDSGATQVESGAAFELQVSLRPGPNGLKLVLRRVDADGGAPPAAVLERRVTRWIVPGWFRALPQEARPALPLPSGLTPSEAPGTYRWERDASILVWVPPGIYPQGTQRADPILRVVQDGERDAFFSGLAHEVELTRGVFLGKYELTWARVARWRIKAGLTRLDQRGEGVKHPASLTLAQAEAYLAWAGLRLPREAEWEAAGRGASGQPYPWGSQPIAAVNLRGERDGHARAAPVGSFRRDRSPFGCFDMGGNLREYTADLFGPYEPGDRIDPRGPTRGTLRVVRGGGWTAAPLTGARLDLRYARRPGEAGERDVGVRVALSP